MSNTELLLTTLEAGVLLAIADLKRIGGPSDWQRERLRKDYAWLLAEQGDILQFRSEKRGETAQAMARLIEAVACAAFQPGGIKVAGLHFEAVAEEQ